MKLAKSIALKSMLLTPGVNQTMRSSMLLEENGNKLISSLSSNAEQITVAIRMRGEPCK